jgi:choline kinase
MPSVKHAVITAAGLGSRLGMNIPKCLVPVAGKPIVEYQLELLAEVEDIRVVIGFHREQVIEAVKKVRPDAIFVCNHEYATTTTLQSLFLGVQGLKNPFLVIDGDVIPEPRGFRDFLAACETTVPLTAIAPAVSTDPVYAVVDAAGSTLTGLTRTPGSPWEWPGISYLYPYMIEDRKTFVYQQLQKYLPVPVLPFTCWEIDTPGDLARVSEQLSHDFTTSPRVER